MTEQEWLTTSTAAMLAWLPPREERVKTGDRQWFSAVSDRKLRLFACACARQVWDKLTDPRSRAAVEVAERYADGEATAEEFRQAHSGAWDSWNPLNPGVVSADTPEALAVDVCCKTLDWLRTDPRYNLVSPATQAALLREIVGNPFRPVTLLWKTCERCDGAGEAQGSDRPFEWSGPGTYPGPCPVCQRSGKVPDSPWLTWNGGLVVALARAAYEERGQKCPECRNERFPGFHGSDSLADAFAIEVLNRACNTCNRDNKSPKHMHGRIDNGTLDPQRLAVLADALEDAGCRDEEILRHLRGEELVFACKRCKRWDDHINCKLTVPTWIPLRGPHVRGCWVLDLLLGKE